TVASPIASRAFTPCAMRGPPRGQGTGQGPAAPCRPDQAAAVGGAGSAYGPSHRLATHDGARLHPHTNRLRAMLDLERLQQRQRESTKIRKLEVGVGEVDVTGNAVGDGDAAHAGRLRGGDAGG